MKVCYFRMDVNEEKIKLKKKRKKKWGKWDILTACTKCVLLDIVNWQKLHITATMLKSWWSIFSELFILEKTECYSRTAKNI